jgi:endonuclease/exonuclease/phosphatase family metal-dependent hydrolase
MTKLGCAVLVMLSGCLAEAENDSLGAARQALTTPNMLRIHTCVGEHAATSDPVKATLQFTSASGAPVGRTLSLPGAGSTVDAWSEFQLGTSDLPEDIERLASLVIAKDGTDAWCIDQVEIEQHGLLRWHFDVRDSRAGTYVSPLRLSVSSGENYIWLDDDYAAFSPTKSVRFSELRIPRGNVALQRPIVLETHTCPEFHSASADPVEVRYVHDGITEIMPLDNAGADRQLGQTDRYLLDEHGVRTLGSLELVKTGTDMWCLDALRLYVGGVKVAERLGRITLEEPNSNTDSFLWSVNKTVGGAASGEGYVGFPLKRAPTQWYGNDPDPVAKVMSFNVRYGACLSERIDGQVSMIVREGVDIVGLQEPKSSTDSQDDYVVKYQTKLEDTGRYAGYDARIHAMVPDHMPIYWREDRFELIAAGSSAAQTAFVPASGNTEACDPKWFGMRWVELLHRPTGRVLTVYNTHPDYGCANRGQAALLAARIRANGHDDEPLVLMGDMNAKPSYDAIEIFTGTGSDQLGLTNAHPDQAITMFKGDCPGESGCRTWATPYATIDYIFHSADLTRLGSGMLSVDPSSTLIECKATSPVSDAIASGLTRELVGGRYSDHTPLFATFELPASPE